MQPETEETRLLIPSSSDPANARTSTRKVLEEKKFTFDKSFWSHKRDDEHYAHQEDVYNSLGEEFLDHNFEGYHTCIFAYGQTGSGKSYTMMGNQEQPGLIPRTCQDLFERIESNETPSVSYSVRVSYFEVYNEHVRDLLVARTDSPYYLKIRESPTEGPYVKDLSEQPVRNYNDIARLMQMGDASRTTASTKMNDTSSRSHAVFTIMLKQIHADMSTDETTERIARIRLVDLAGSERAKATEASGARLREGSNINKSLTTLGRVIAALADSSASGTGTPKKRSRQAPKEVVPYRDSILTWLLKDSLGGNSKTAMIACVAPSDYDETLSTLRYADQAKRIKTRAVVNQDSITSAERDAQITDMQQTIRNLQISLAQREEKEASLAQQAMNNHQAVARQQAAAMKRENSAQTQQLEEYQKQVQKMQQLMEETRQVSDCKIHALRTENEALRLHLKLAVDSIKNPVVVPSAKLPKDDAPKEPFPKESIPKARQARVSAFPAIAAIEPPKERSEPASRVPSTTSISPPLGSYTSPQDDKVDEGQKEREWDDGSETDVDPSEAEAMELQGQMKDLLKDLGMFKRKLGDDQSRFMMDRPRSQGPDHYSVLGSTIEAA